ncbi:MAG: glycoside hydrolase family 95 protein [Victivallales bacterium]|jgi:alpha-L-fucosidase 2
MKNTIKCDSPDYIETGGRSFRPLRIVSHQPANTFTEGTPIGNGQLGATIFGNVGAERLGLNDVTLWSGEPSDWNNPDAKVALPEIRRLLFDGKIKEAEMLCRRLQGPYAQAYMPMGNLMICFEHASVQGWGQGGPVLRGGSGASAYLRELDLRTAVATVEYGFGAVRYKREYFASNPGQVIAIRFSASAAGRMSFLARMDSLLRYLTLVEDSTFILRGKAPRHAEPNYEDVDPAILYADDETGPGMNFECHLRAIVRGGRTWTDHDGVHVQGADEVMLLVSAATSFAGYDKSPSREGIDPRPVARARLDAAAKQTFDQLQDTHIRDYQALFNRVDLHLEGSISDPIPAEIGFSPMPPSTAPEAIALGYQYSRYRTISASRPGGQPLTLCGGMWNESVRPPWSFNYTINENLQKHYSGVEVANLSECAEPYIDLMRGLAVNGRKTAEVNYGLPGWLAHHNTDLWRHTGAVGRYGEGRPTWACFQLGGAWLCENLYNHYLFNGDQAFLRDTAYPILKGASEFALAWLVEDPKTGYLVTAPSTSPENEYLLPDGQRAAVTIGSAIDISLIWELFKNTIAAAHTLGIDEDFQRQLEQAQARLQPLKIGSHGRILEWYGEYPEAMPDHHHASLLVGLAWGTRITRRGTPELFAAARRTLEIRGTGGILPCKLSMCARLEDGELCYRFLDTSLNMAELFLQSRYGEIHFLPALPNAWPTGYVKGLKACGSYVVDVEWREGRILKGTIHAKFDGRCRVRADASVDSVTSDGQRISHSIPEENVAKFDVQAGRTYELSLK